MLRLAVLACGLTFLGFVCFSHQRAEASWLDPTFGNHGKVSGRSFGMNWEGSPDWGIKAITFDRWGRIIIAGGQSIVRLSAAGIPDPGFGQAGVSDWTQFFPDDPYKLPGFPYPRSLIALPDGKIIEAGHSLPDPASEFAFMIRLNVDGSLDTGFGRKGWTGPKLMYHASYGDAALDRRGRIVVVGSKGFTAVMVSRFTPDGRLDRSFGKGGILGIGAPKSNTGHMLSSVRVLSSGRILAAGTIGSRPVIVAVKANGKIDRRFGKNGFAWGPKMPPQGCGFDHTELCVTGNLVRLSDGRFVLGSVLTRDDWRSIVGALIAFHPDGRRARGYGRHGVLRLTYRRVSRGTGRRARSAMDATGLVPLSRGRVFVLGGYEDGNRVVRKVGILVNRKGRPIKVRRPVFIGPENWSPYDGYNLLTGTAAKQPNGKVLVAAWENSPENTKRHPRQNIALYRLKIPR